VNCNFSASRGKGKGGPSRCGAAKLKLHSAAAQREKLQLQQQLINVAATSCCSGACGCRKTSRLLAGGKRAFGRLPGHPLDFRLKTRSCNRFANDLAAARRRVNHKPGRTPSPGTPSLVSA